MTYEEDLRELENLREDIWHELVALDKAIKTLKRQSEHGISREQDKR